TNRPPFDLPEAESELVGGFHTEYSSMKFAMFFLAEYVNMVIVSAFATMLFLGGGMAPWPLTLIGDNMLNSGWWPLMWFFLKMLLFLFGFIWLMGTLPRMRYVQFMKLGWKVLVPANLVWIVLIAGIHAIQVSGTVTTSEILIFGGVAIVVVVLLSMLLPERRPPDEESVWLSGGDYPAPPADLEVPEHTPRQKAALKAAAKAQRRKALAEGNDSAREDSDRSVSSEAVPVSKEGSDGNV